jgi:hypothetical protein
LADSEPVETALRDGAPALDSDPEWMDTPVADLVKPMLKNNID